VQLKRIFGGVFNIIVLFLSSRGLRIDKLTDDETDALADPAARMLHGRKRLQAAIEKATDPALFGAAALAIVEARLARAKGLVAPSAPPAAGAGASGPPQRPAAPAAGIAASAQPHQRPAPASPPAQNGGGAGTPQDQDFDKVNLTPEGVQATLDDMFAGMVAHG